MPATQRSASSRLTLASSRIDSSTLRAITGSITFSSKLPEAPAKVTAASLPITWAQTMVVASQITGLTLPGMIEDPGCRSGSAISPSPARGPEPIQRRSLAILFRLTAMVRSAPEASTSPSRAPWASKWSRASVSGRPGLPDDDRDHRGGEAGRGVDPGADRGAAQRQLGHPGQRGLDPLDAVADLRRVPAELLAQGDRGGVHQVGPAALDHLGELGPPWPAALPRGAAAPGPGR